MSDDKPEWGPCWLAEALALQSNLDKGIFGNKFDIFIKAPENISDVALQAFVNRVFFISNFFILVNDVFKDNSDECN